MSIMTADSNSFNMSPLDSPNLRKRKPELQYLSNNSFDPDQKLFDLTYYSSQQQQQQQHSFDPHQHTSLYNNNNLNDSFNNDSQFMGIQPEYHNQPFINHHEEQEEKEEEKYASSAIHHQILHNNQVDNTSQFNNNHLSSRNTLHLDDLKGPKDLQFVNQQRDLLIQAWTNSNTETNNRGDTPSMFSPGFLECLQEEDENNSKTSSGFHFPIVNDYQWNQSPSHMMDDRMLSQEPTGVFTNHNSASSSPIPNMGNSMTISANPFLSTSSISSSSSTSSPPPITSSSILLSNFTQDTTDQWLSSLYPVQSTKISQADDITLQPIIRNYLSNQYANEERTVVILTSKVAQKSYGTEKRFLCPPPTAILVGTNWWTYASQPNEFKKTDVLKTLDGIDLYPPKMTVSISGETAVQQGQIEWSTLSGTNVGYTGNHPSSTKSENSQDVNDSKVVQHPSRFRSSAESKTSGIDSYRNHHHEMLSLGKCVSKHLFINDADEKRKRVEALVRIQLANGIQLNTLASKGIKVISKPSKKRQSSKNLELCIHHGTTVSLFNRIRSQTVSTKYLGVSSSNKFPGQPYQRAAVDEGTCFVARTTCWDPFIIWIVDTQQQQNDEGLLPEDYIGKNTSVSSSNYPPPPAIALKNKSNQLIPIHYNQHVVLQCLTTGLVSPVMIIRKVDKASTVVGGALKSTDEYGDEVLGDPVSQLHKIALQIVQQGEQFQQQQHYQQQTYIIPHPTHPITYLACLNDMVGMHKTTEPRKPTVMSSTKPNEWNNIEIDNLFNITSQEGGKIIRKRRVSMDPAQDFSKPMNEARRRVQSLNNYDDQFMFSTKPSVSRKSSVSSSGSGRRGSVQNSQSYLGAYWQEDVSDVAVWTIVGTDCETYTFLSPKIEGQEKTHTTILPSLHQFTVKNITDKEQQMSLNGENFSRDIQVWLGDMKTTTEYRSREFLICKISRQELFRIKEIYNNQIPILFVKGDGTICKTNKFYQL